MLQWEAKLCCSSGSSPSAPPTQACHVIAYTSEQDTPTSIKHPSPEQTLKKALIKKWKREKHIYIWNILLCEWIATEVACRLWARRRSLLLWVIYSTNWLARPSHPLPGLCIHSIPLIPHTDTWHQSTEILLHHILCCSVQDTDRHFSCHPVNKPAQICQIIYHAEFLMAAEWIDICFSLKGNNKQYKLWVDANVLARGFNIATLLINRKLFVKLSEFYNEFYEFRYKSL